MLIEKGENKSMLIHLDKKNDREIYNRIGNKDPKDYFEYLFKLDHKLNGTDDTLIEYPRPETYKEQNSKSDADELISKCETLLKDMESRLYEIVEVNPNLQTHFKWRIASAFPNTTILSISAISISN